MRGLLAPLIKLTVFIVTTVLVTAVLAFSIANMNLGATTVYSARFADATQLLPGDDVRIAGVRVGQIDEVRVVDRRIAEVDFEVSSGRELPAGVIAKIQYRNLIGQRYLELNRGTGAGQGKLHPGDTIPIEQTKPAVDLTMLFNGFKPLFRALSPDDVNKLSYEIVQVLQGEGGTVESLLKHTASLTNTIAAKDAVIGSVITNLNEVLDTVNQRTPQLNNLITRLQQVVSGLASDREPIGEAIESLGTLAGTTSGLLADAREPLKKDVAALGDLVGNLNENEPLVEHFIQFLPKKTTTLSKTVSYGSWFNFFSCRLRASVSIPGLPVKDVMLPLAPISKERCGA